MIEAGINLSQNEDLSFNVREITIFFLECIGDSFGKKLARKKELEVLQQIVNCGFKIASESTEEYPDEEESPHSLALHMLYNYASAVPTDIIYPMFKTNILACAARPEELFRKAALKVMGHVSDSDALLDAIKDDCEELTELLCKGLVDPSMQVREAAAEVVGQFSANIVPDFLQLHAKVMPQLLSVVKE